MEDKLGWAGNRLESGLCRATHGVGFDSSVFRPTMIQHTSSSIAEESLQNGNILEGKFYYEGFGELVKEWKDSGTEESIWSHLGMSEHSYKSWVVAIKSKTFDV